MQEIKAAWLDTFGAFTYQPCIQWQGIRFLAAFAQMQSFTGNASGLLERLAALLHPTDKKTAADACKVAEEPEPDMKG